MASKSAGGLMRGSIARNTQRHFLLFLFLRLQSKSMFRWIRELGDLLILHNLVRIRSPHVIVERILVKCLESLSLLEFLGKLLDVIFQSSYSLFLLLLMLHHLLHHSIHLLQLFLSFIFLRFFPHFIFFGPNSEVHRAIVTIGSNRTLLVGFCYERYISFINKRKVVKSSSLFK